MTRARLAGWSIGPIDIAGSQAAQRLWDPCGLTPHDMLPSDCCFLAPRLEERRLGLIGLELHTTAGLARSMAVAPDARRCGIAQDHYQHLEVDARRRGPGELYALTETAGPFFEKARFERVARTQAPAGIAGASQFKSLCPASAAFLRRRLTDPVIPEGHQA